MEDYKKIPVIAIVGPTASGKTSFSIELAKKYNGEIISADSMQIYKGMGIATATPSREEMSYIPHHMLSFLDINKTFSVAEYLDLAHIKAKEIYSRGNLPIIVGGTGLYIDNFLDYTDFFNIVVDKKNKEKLETYAKNHGGRDLLSKLMKVDPDLGKKLHYNQHDKIIRGLLVFDATKTPLSFHQKQSKLKESPYTFVIIGLNYETRQNLYNKIDSRVDRMVKDGLIEEAEIYYIKELSATSRAAIGHKELFPYIDGRITKEEAIENLKRSTRRYAKRQITWFKKNKNIKYIYIDRYKNFEEVLDEGFKIINDSKILD